MAAILSTGRWVNGWYDNVDIIGGGVTTDTFSFKLHNVQISDNSVAVGVYKPTHLAQQSVQFIYIVIILDTLRWSNKMLGNGMISTDNTKNVVSPAH